MIHNENNVITDDDLVMHDFTQEWTTPVDLWYCINHA